MAETQISQKFEFLADFRSTKMTLSATRSWIPLQKRCLVHTNDKHERNRGHESSPTTETGRGANPTVIIPPQTEQNTLTPSQRHDPLMVDSLTLTLMTQNTIPARLWIIINRHRGIKENRAKDSCPQSLNAHPSSCSNHCPSSSDGGIKKIWDMNWPQTQTPTCAVEAAATLRKCDHSYNLGESNRICNAYKTIPPPNGRQPYDLVAPSYSAESTKLPLLACDWSHDFGETHSSSSAAFDECICGHSAITSNSSEHSTAFQSATELTCSPNSTLRDSPEYSAASQTLAEVSCSSPAATPSTSPVPNAAPQPTSVVPYRPSATIRASRAPSAASSPLTELPYSPSTNASNSPVPSAAPQSIIALPHSPSAIAIKSPMTSTETQPLAE